MAVFEIDGKEYELKLTYAGVKRLNGAFDGGAYEIIGKSLSGDLEAFPIIVHAALIHTGENFTQKTIDEQIEKLFDEGALSFEDVFKLCDEVVTQSGFFAPTVAKMAKKNPEMKAALEQLRD